MRGLSTLVLVAAVATAEEAGDLPAAFEWRQLLGSATHDNFRAREDSVLVPKVIWHAPDAAGQPTLSDGWLFAGGPVLGRYAASTGKFERSGLADARRVGATPVLTDDAVIVRRPDGMVEAYTRNLRKLRWKTGTESPDVHTDHPAAHDGDFYVINEGSGVRALRVRDGRTAWKFRSDRGEVAMTPAIAAGRVCFGSVGGNVWALDLTSGKQLWKIDTLEGSGWSQPVLAGRTLFLSDRGIQYADRERKDGHLHAIDSKSGRRLWSQPHAGTWTSTPGLGADRIVLGTRKVVLQFGRISGREMHKPLGVDNAALGTPTIVGSTLYLGTVGGYLQARDLRTGALKWRLRIPGTRPNKRPHEVHSIVHTGTRIYVETTNGLYCLGQDPHRRGVRPQGLTITASG